jgi:hypothetical protein
MNKNDLINLPNDPELKIENDVTTLDDAISNVGPTPETMPPAPPPPAMTNQQILGMVALLSSMGLPSEVAESYKKDLTEDFMLSMFLEMSGLAEGLAEYGIGGGGGVMPAWMKVILGTAALGFFVWQKRAKYGSSAIGEPVEVKPENSGFDGAWGFSGQGGENAEAV